MLFSNLGRKGGTFWTRPKSLQVEGEGLHRDGQDAILAQAKLDPECGKWSAELVNPDAGNQMAQDVQMQSFFWAVRQRKEKGASPSRNGREGA